MSSGAWNTAYKKFDKKHKKMKLEILFVGVTTIK
jgi:hypothetical protein